MDVRRYEQLKTDVARFNRAADRAEGEKSATIRALKDEFGCGSIKDAQELLEKLTEEEKSLADQYNEKLAEFEENWSSAISEL